MSRQVISLFIRVAIAAAGCWPLLVAMGCASTAPQGEWVSFPSPPSPPRVVHLKSFNGLDELVAPRTSFLDVLRGRRTGPSVGVPAGIAYRDGRLYICDTEAGAVHVWNLVDGSSQHIGTSADTVFGEPVDVAVAESGTVYVADTARNEVLVFSPAGALLRTLKPPHQQAWRPVALAIRADRVFATDIAAHQVHVFSTTTAKHVAAFGNPGSAPGKMFYPTGVALNATGEIHVSEMMNARVQIFDAEFNSIVCFGQPGDRYGDMGKPKHLDVAADGTIILADAEFARVHLYGQRGELLLLVGGPRDEPGGTPLPIGVAVAESLPERVQALVPCDFSARYFFFVTNSVGQARISLFAVGERR